MERLLEGNADVEGCHLFRKQKKEIGGLIGGFLYEEYFGVQREVRNRLCACLQGPRKIKGAQKMSH